MIIIYGKNDCKWCKLAVVLAEARGLRHEYRNIQEYEGFKIELKTLLPDVKTVPQIWIDNRHIGGYTEFTAEIENISGGFSDGQI